MAKRVLITGAAGFIGRHLINELSVKGIEFTGIDHIEVPELNIKEVSLLKYKEMRDIIADYKPNVIVHLAAIALATYGDTAEIYNVNVCGTENLFKVATEVCDKGTRVILISTAGVYGNQNKEFYDEDLSFNPENHYSFSKMITEFLAKQYSDLDIKIVRPFNIIGEGQKRVFLIPKLVEHFAYKKPELRIGNLKPERDYVDINYCVDILSELIVRENIEYNIYNICSGIGYSVQDVIDILKEYSNFCPEIVVDPKFVRKNEVWRMVGKPDRLLSLMNGKTCQSFEIIIKNMYNSYL